MKNSIKIILLVWFSVVLLASINGQGDHFNIAAQFRIRPEFRNGYRSLGSDDSKAAFFNTQRSRLLFDFKRDKISFFASIQDSRTWGDEEQKKDIAGLQVNQLWAAIALDSSFTLKLGRQELAYDDHRLLGNLDWGNLSVSHDALLLQYQKPNKAFKWHLGLAFNQQGEPTFGTTYLLNNYKFLGFTWFNHTFNSNHSISGIIIANGVEVASDILPSSTKYTYTLGPIYSYHGGDWKTTLGAYYQGGKTVGDQTKKAFMINAFVDRKLSAFHLGLGADYISGNSATTSATENHSFSTLYATNHKFYGYMDYFINIPSDTKNGGLIDLYLRANYDVTKKVSTALTIHQFSLANVPSTAGIGKQLGNEIDATMDYAPMADVQLQMGYSIMLASENMEYLKTGNANNFNTWAYLMLKVSPTLFHK